jgi:hypothetical protein
MATGFSLRAFDGIRLDDAGDFLATQARSTSDGLRDLIGPDMEDALRNTMDDLQVSFTNFQDDLLGGQPQDLPAADPLAELRSAVGELDIARLEGFATSLPPELSGPDETGEVPTGASSIARPEAALGAELSASARIVRAIGPEAETVQAEGRSFQVVGRYDDPVSGFDAIHLRALDGTEDVFALDGLEVGSEPDTLAALALGRPQAESPEFTRLVAEASNAALLEGRSLMFVGPSLGGALAQVAAYETSEALLAAGATPGTGAVRLVTVDPLGGRDAAESLNGGSLDPAVLEVINALNLRTEGDLISRIGSHIGETISFRPVNSAGEPVMLSTADAHVNVESLLATLRSDALFAAGERGAPAEIGGFARLSNSLADRVTEEAQQLEVLDSPEGDIPLQVPGTARFDGTGTNWIWNADQNGVADLVVGLSAPVADSSDLIFG